MLRTRTTAVVAFLLLLGRANLTSAQAISPNPAFATVGNGLIPASDALDAFNAELRRATQPTHWVRGGLIGAGIGAATLLVLGAAVACPMSDEGCDAGNYAAGALLGGGLGFLVGALVGGQFPKQESLPAETEAKRCLTGASC